MAESIRAFCLNRFAEGATAEQVWKEVETRFPNRCGGWNYVSRLAREHERGKQE